MDRSPFVNPLEHLPCNDKGQVLVGIDNFAALQALVSDEFSAWSNVVTVDQALINRFAELSGDNGWMHTDSERALQESPFGTTVAQGALVQVLLSRFTLDLLFEISGFNVMVNYGSDRIRFLEPVPAGSQIHSRVRVKSVKKSDKGTAVTLEVNIHVIGNENPSVINDQVILYR